MDASCRLVTYGTLGPGRPNHHQVAELGGEWTGGTVRGHLRHEGWGAAQGYPGIVLDPEGLEIEVMVLEAECLPNHWPRLDAFEGEGYQRVVTPVVTSDGVVLGSIYVLK